ncbi:hypothetical protein BT69DRAFT_1345593 [Atractiella rhizophila]|nr:hypothetical protein BT69DRAFT_1345593 [Atractiella rhizophila]
MAADLAHGLTSPAIADVPVTSASPFNQVTAQGVLEVTPTDPTGIRNGTSLDFGNGNISLAHIPPHSTFEEPINVPRNGDAMHGMPFNAAGYARISDVSCFDSKGFRRNSPLLDIGGAHNRHHDNIEALGPSVVSVNETTSTDDDTTAEKPISSVTCQNTVSGVVSQKKRVKRVSRAVCQKKLDWTPLNRMFTLYFERTAKKIWTLEELQQHNRNPVEENMDGPVIFSPSTKEYVEVTCGGKVCLPSARDKRDRDNFLKGQLESIGNCAHGRSFKFEGKRLAAIVSHVNKDGCTLPQTHPALVEFAKWCHNLSKKTLPPAFSVNLSV